jgi:hypothetical protein
MFAVETHQHYLNQHQIQTALTSQHNDTTQEAHEIQQPN